MFHIITPCSRPNNLQAIYENINAIKPEKLLWHICFDTSKVTETNKVKNDLNHDWIRFYTASTDFIPNPGKSQINFVLTHLHLDIFEPGFVYVLDDDNLLPPDFFKYDYNENESLIYLTQQLCNNNHVRQPVPIVNQIDQGQIIIHSKLHHFYDLYHNGDGLMIEKMCKKNKHKKLIYPITYYNRLNK